MQKISPILIKKIKRILLNKYVFTFLVFAVVIIFFDHNNLISRFTTDRKTRQIEREIEHYEQQIKSNRQQINKLQTDKDSLEKFAREKYLMKKQDEEIFIIKEK
jgi:cell division protein FtsB